MISNGTLICRYPSYCRPNIWPADHLAELEIGTRLTVLIFESILQQFMTSCKQCINISPRIISFIAFKALGKLMLEVGLMLARHCDLYGMHCVNVTLTQHVLWRNIIFAVL
jgi:hypothetical protein